MQISASLTNNAYETNTPESEGCNQVFQYWRQRYPHLFGSQAIPGAAKGHFWKENILTHGEIRPGLCGSQEILRAVKMVRS